MKNVNILRIGDQENLQKNTEQVMNAASILLNVLPLQITVRMLELSRSALAVQSGLESILSSVLTAVMI